MHAHDDSQQRAELRLAFLKHLPNRLEHLARRGRHFCRVGWDINGLALLFEDVERLAGAAGTHGALDASQQLHAIESVLGGFLDSESLPDAPANSRLEILFDGLAPAGNTEAPASRPTAPSGETLDSARIELPPSHYWRRWSSDATPPQPISPSEVLAANEAITEDAGDLALGIGSEALDAALRPDAKLSVEIKVHSATPPTASEAVEPPKPRPPTDPKATTLAPAIRPAARPAPPPATISAQAGGRIYHLSDSSALSVELDQQLETAGFELELLETTDELKEVLAALPPDLILVDAGFVGDLEAIGPVLRSTRERTTARLLLVALAAEDSVPVRLSARRAGADALLVNPRDATEVLGKLQALLAGNNEETFRILIVEDDRSQALFAESILRNAGMEARVVLDAFEVLKAMEEFQPDMVLMDLYMPECDGTELTALIREREEFLQTPIVFLSGESDVDKHYDALEAGGDDFLSKPIRPKHLIAAVSNRVRRARAVQRRVAEQNPRDASTGLYFRSHLLDRLSGLIASPEVRQRAGGLLFIDIDGLPQLREKLGLAGIERLLSEAGKLLVSEIEETDLATRFSDGCFIVLCPDLGDGALEARGTAIRAALSQRAFEIDGRPVRLRPAIGICALRFGFADAGTLLNTAERLSREARASERGVRVYEPPKRADQTRTDALVASIRQAIERDGFELLYQPIVAVQGGEEAQYQTLLRMRDESGGLLTAAQIVPLAESHDLMVDIDRWVLGQAMRVIETQRAAGTSVRLFVNQSASTLVTADQAEWLISQLKARGVPGSSLVIELTLDNIEAHADAVQSFCHKMVPRDVGFCLSRFEAGDMADLVAERLPLSFVKLAPKYVSAQQTPALKAELGTLVKRAHAKGLSVIAQRVEDAQAAATLWMSGIDFMQGNLVQAAEATLGFDFQAAVL